VDFLRHAPAWVEKILNFFGLRIIRPLKHELKMTNEELLHYYNWTVRENFNTLSKDFLEEMEKRNLIKK